MTARAKPFDTAEARLIDALFRGDGDAAVAQFAGEPRVDANIVGRVEGREALLELARRWHRVFNLDRPGPVAFRESSASGSRSMTEVQVTVPDGDGTAVLPVGIVGLYEDDTRTGRLVRANVYFYEKVLNGSEAVRPPSYDHRGGERPITADQLGGVNAEYYDAVSRLDLEGVLRTFTPDATIEIGTSVVPPDQVRRLYEQFIGDEVMLYFSSQIHEPGSFTVEWASGHLDPPASGMGIYLFDEAGRIRSIRMYDHFDPSTIDGLRLEPIQLGGDPDMTRPNYAAELVDRIAILDLYARYVHALDDHDWAALDEIFVPETTMDWTSSGHIRGEYARDVRPEYERNSGIFFLDIHYCTNVRIDLDPDLRSARVKSKTLNVAGMRTPEGDPKMAQVHGEYSDRLEKRGGDWKIIDRYWHHQGVTLGAQLAEGTGGMLGN